MDEIESGQLLVDNRARAAAENLRRVVALRAVPARRTPPSRRVFGPVAITAAVLLVVAGLAAVPRLRSDPVRPTQAPLGLLWVVTELPEGWQLVTTSGPSDIEPSGPSAKVYYATDEAPAGPIVEVSASATSPVEAADARNVEDIVVGGVDLQVADGPYGQRWAYNVELETMVSAVNLDQATLEQIAAGLELSADGTPIANVHTLPTGVAEVGAVTAANNGMSVDLRTNSVAISSYGPAPGSGVKSSAMFLAVSETSRLTAAVFGMSAPNLRPSSDAVVGVRFESGVSNDLRKAMWTYKGLTFWIVATGISAEELERASQSVVESSPAEWSVFVVDDQAPTDAASASVTPGTSPASTDETEMPTTTVEPASSPTSVDDDVFCAELGRLSGEQPETYVGSAEHIADAQALMNIAPPDVADDVQVYLDFLKSGFITNADPGSNVVANWPVDVQAAVNAIHTFETTRC